MCNVEITRIRDNRMDVKVGCVSFNVYIDDITHNGVTKPLVTKSKSIWIDENVWEKLVELVLVEYRKQKGILT